MEWLFWWRVGGGWEPALGGSLPLLGGDGDLGIRRRSHVCSQHASSYQLGVAWLFRSGTVLIT